MPGHPYPHTDRELLRRVERAGGRAGYKQLVRELGMGGGRERRMLLEQLAKMTARGALVKIDAEQWALPQVHTERVKNDTGRRAVAQDRKRLVHDRSAARSDLIAGKLQLHRDGFGFVRPTDATTQSDGDYFIPPHDLNGAMQGDIVLVLPAPPSRDGRKSGRIMRVLTRRNPTVVGIFHAAGARGRSEDMRLRGSYVVPLDERMTQPVLIENDQDLPSSAITPHRTLGAEAAANDHQWDGTLEDLNGLAVDVEITQYPTDNSPARGRVIEVLGDPDAFGVDVEIIIRKHHLPHVFPAGVLAEAEDAAERNVASLLEEELNLRRDFRDEPIVTIDGETAKDFDDAVLVRKHADNTWELQVHIADVAEYVRDNSDLDLEARLRGNSVYFPDRAIPMLPQQLSNGECSLRPDEDRMVLSCIARIDDEGNVLGYEICEGLIRSARRMTYTNVQKILDGDEEVRKLYEPLLPQFERMYELALKLNGKRVRRGSIDFDLPEPVIDFNELGAMQGVRKAERAWANRIIEEFMLCANECVARWIETSGVPGMYRIHEMPDPKRIIDFEDAAAAFGITLGVGALPVKSVTMKSDRRDQQRRGQQGRVAHKAREHEVSTAAIEVTPHMYQRLAAKIHGRPEERILSYLMLRSLKQAKYSEKNEGHFALAAPAYTHFTSPIRRYPDLVVHRILKTLLADGADPFGDAEEIAAPQGYLGIDEAPKRDVHHGEQQFEDVYPKDELIAIAQECSETERRAADAERELIEWKKIKFMTDRVGEDFDAMILSVTKYGMFVELADMFVEGLVPIFTLTDDHYTYRETTREIRGGKSNKTYRPGMKVRVLLDRIDRGNRRLQFAVIPDHAAGETALPEGVRPFPKRASRSTERREKTVAEAPTRTRKPSPRSAKRSKAKAAPLSSSSPFAKFGADGSSVRKKKNKDRIAASKKKGKKR
ncbi:VacB/RNase II-like 3'-5' exoribonuclease [Terriglobus roseus DSM 18391]|uniref:Ribonuclease R n=1 Tax=Terriglobus roseus (strain DSM 18391 / NRRL B-41598 / KBS 63) TaxID=926566 RepID=I3ZBE0_TERRK|nr:VacB/RNase II family 3'-5' exoribonuclease [Terriglobus roseus]AFL86558.1 VacB/RNase II-like 3'-5' exoribonuclease [Terriglobus roseus DSM 18391]